MTPDWPIEKLEDLVESSRGISYGIVQPGKHQPNGVPIIRVSDLKGNTVETMNPLRVSPEIEASYSRTRLRGGELIVSIVGTVGQTAIVDHSLAGWNVARAVAVIPVKEDVGPYWIRLALKGGPARAHINDRLNTTVQATLNLRDLASLPILLPPASERNAIAATLGALDDKIELNRKMNATLEAIARALFRDWFVDFGPTRAKMEGLAPYLSPDLWPLFPDRLDEEGKPEGWEVGTLSDLATLNPESWTARNAPETVAYVDLANTKWGSIDKVEHYAWTDAPSRARRILRGGDTIVGTVRPGNGSFCYVGEDGLTGSTGFAVLRPKSPRDRAFVWCASTSGENIDRLAHLADGGAYPAVRPDAVAATEVVIPSEVVLAAFRDAVSANIDLMVANKTESRTLAKTRDLLLPRLMSGELRVADVEHIASEVA